MDFFEHQDRARRSTARLVLYFVLAVISIIALTYVIVAGALSRYVEGIELWDPLLLAWVAGAVVVVVSGGSFYKVSQLDDGGGASVAEMLGGRLLSQGSDDPVERRVLNVVEEMAIASGTPVPPVYLLPEEDRINAFAAGYAPEDAVLGITRGCATRLTRDQLQGVVAHEFSHMLHGDMRLNIRLMGVLHGILIIGIIGYYVLRLLFSGPRVRRSRSRDKGGGLMLAILAIAVGLMVVGFAGTFFGNLIKAAVSRQREYLADASAVQFTRNPRGISGALQQIGAVGAAVDNPRAAEASHMFFGRAVVKGLHAVFATHPPLPERIRRVDSSWEGEFPEPQPEWTGPEPEPAAAGEDEDGIDDRDVLLGAAIASAAAAPGRDEGESAVRRIGRVDDAHLAYARELLGGLPRAFADAAREPYGAQAVVYAMLIGGDESVRRRQIASLAEHVDAALHRFTLGLLEQAGDLAPEARLPLLDITASSLRSLSRSQYEGFVGAVETLIHADDEVDLFEWTLQRLILHRLEPNFRGARPPTVQYYALERLTGPCSLLLSTLAHQGHGDPETAAAAFEVGRAALGVDGVALAAEGECGLGDLGAALDVLVTVAPRLKNELLQACAACIAADKTVTVREGELLRAVSDSLGCPMPPLLPGQPLV